MLLLKLTTCNFRSFYGTQHVNFAASNGKALTVIHGENGAGKTNLLNAIYWCLTGAFTPRLSNPELLLNKTAYDEANTSECFVELIFSHDRRGYQAIRTVTGRNQSVFNLYVLEESTLVPVPNAQQFVERIIPKALSRWFFFDAEAIGELELSGSEEFRRSLRRVLGFELVDTLVEDLHLCLLAKQRNLANLVNSKDLDEIQSKIEQIQSILPAQRAKSRELEGKLLTLDAEIARIEEQLRELPKSKPLQERRTKLDLQRKQKAAARRELQDELAKFIGEAAPAVLAFPQAMSFEDHLHIKENNGRLPAPYSDQLVEDILRDGMCVCGRPVDHDSPESAKIRGLLKSASTTGFNARVRSVQYLLKDIRRTQESYAETLASRARKIEAVDAEVAGIDDELGDIRRQLQQIDEQSVRALEAARNEANSKYRDAHSELAILKNYDLATLRWTPH